MLDSLDAWANGDTINGVQLAPIARAVAPRARTKSSRRNAVAARNAALAAATTTPAQVMATPVPATRPAAFSSTATGDLALDDLKSAYPAEHGWICDNAARGNPFAFSLLRSVRRFGNLSPKQLGAVTAAIAKEAATGNAAPAPQSAPVTPVNVRAGSMGSVQATPAPAPYTAPVAVVPVTTAEAFKLSPDPLADHWPVLFTDESGHAVADTGGNVLCIAVQGLPVKLARFSEPGRPPVSVAMSESVWRDFKAMSRADFILTHLAG